MLSMCAASDEAVAGAGLGPLLPKSIRDCSAAEEAAEAGGCETVAAAEGCTETAG